MGKVPFPEPSGNPIIGEQKGHVQDPLSKVGPNESSASMMAIPIQRRETAVSLFDQSMYPDKDADVVKATIEAGLR
jgi:hypothetical protein